MKPPNAEYEICEVATGFPSFLRDNFEILLQICALWGTVEGRDKCQFKRWRQSSLKKYAYTSREKNSELHLHDCEKLSLEVRKHALFASYFLLASK